MTAPMKKSTRCVIYIIKVNYTSYNYVAQKYMDVPYFYTISGQIQILLKNDIWTFFFNEFKIL